MSTKAGDPPHGLKPRSKLEELMMLHRISVFALQVASGLDKVTIQALRKSHRMDHKRLSSLARCASALGLSIAEVFPVVTKSPRRPGLIARSLADRQRERRGKTATG